MSRESAFLTLTGDQLSSSIFLTRFDRSWLMAASGFHRSRKLGRAMRSACREIDQQCAQQASDPTVSWEPMQRWNAMARFLHTPRGWKDASHLEELRRSTPTKLSLELALMAAYRPLWEPSPKASPSLPPLPLEALDCNGKDAEAADVPISPTSVTSLMPPEAYFSKDAISSSSIGRSCRMRCATALLAIALESRRAAGELVAHGILLKSPTALLLREGAHIEKAPVGAMEMDKMTITTAGCNAYVRARRTWSPARARRLPAHESPTGAELEAMEQGLLPAMLVTAKVHPV